jgi:hypothetical protein
LAIRDAKKDVSKIAELIAHLENLPTPAHEQLLAYLGSDSVMTIPEGDRLCLWSKLVDKVTKHRKFADAEWAMNPAQVDKIATLTDQLAPDSSFFLHQRLFSEREFELYEENSDYEKQAKDLEKRRQVAVEEVAASGGTEAVLAFASAVESPWRVGIAFGAVASLEADVTVLPALLESENKLLAQFVGGFVRGRFHGRGWEWVDGIQTSQWTPMQIGQLFSFLPFTLDTWERVKSLLGDDQSVYWSKTTANPYEAKAGLELAIGQLIEQGRPYAAIRCLHRMLHDKQPFDNRKAVRALIEALNSAEVPHSMDVYEIIEIIKALQKDQDTNPDDLFRVEWAYLPLLVKDHDASPKLLSRRLADDPRFFCEVIRLVFRSKKGERLPEEVTEERQNLAAHAYRLLREWRIPPGLGEDAAYDGNALKGWLYAVKKECTETGHLEIAMTQVGHVLIHVPADPDGLWLHHSAAEVLNAKDGQDMRNGFRNELYNSRGGHDVDPTGKPERDLAAGYSRQAEAVENAGYYRLASVLRELAELYEREAERVSSRDLIDV